MARVLAERIVLPRRSRCSMTWRKRFPKRVFPSSDKPPIGRCFRANGSRLKSDIELARSGGRCEHGSSQTIATAQCDKVDVWKADYLRELCRVGRHRRIRARSLLNTVHPLSGEAATDELEPIGDLGLARYEISQGNWDAGIDVLTSAKSKGPAETALRGRILAHQQDLSHSKSGSRTRRKPGKKLPTTGLPRVSTMLIGVIIKRRCSLLLGGASSIQPTLRRTHG